MKLAIGGDHRGIEAMQGVASTLRGQGHHVALYGRLEAGSSDYPDAAWEVASRVAAGEADRGLLFCGSGIGMSIAANKVKGVRAALVHDEPSAESSRAHNNANVLCLPADLLNSDEIDRIINVWLSTEFAGGRHARRVLKIEAIEQGQSPAQLAE